MKEENIVKVLAIVRHTLETDDTLLCQKLSNFFSKLYTDNREIESFIADHKEKKI